MAVDHHVDLESAVTQVTARLVKEFSGRIDPPVVEKTVRECAGEYVTAHIWAFVPVFIERQSARRLKEMLGPSSFPRRREDRRAG